MLDTQLPIQLQISNTVTEPNMHWMKKMKEVDA